MKKNNPPPIKLETIDLDDDYPEKTPSKQTVQRPVEQNATFPKAKVIVYPPRAQSTPKEIPKEVPPVVPVQNNLNVVQRNVQSPIMYVNSASTNVDSTSVDVLQGSPKVYSVSGLKAIIKTVVPQSLTREYMIPLKDFSEKEKPIIATMRRQSAAPMTIIHHHTPDKMIMDEVVSLKTDAENSIEKFAIAAKRRASVGNPTGVSQEIKSPPNMTRVLPSKEFRCSECLAPFATSRLLKYHVDNSCDRRPQSTTSRALNSFKCFDCNNSFASYYFLRRHRETCTMSLRVKCTFQYCRFRATNPGDIQKHFAEVHAQKLTCKECDEVFTSQGQLIAHEVTKHGKEDPKTRKRTSKRQIKPPAKRVREPDLDFDSNTVIECEQCKDKVQPKNLANHIATCRSKR